jgi:hypothetical protein
VSHDFITGLATFLEPLGPLEKGAAILGNAGQFVTAAFAVIALGFAWAQIRSARVAQLEATLQELNRDQNRASMENPRFANPQLGKISFENETFDGDRDQFERYVWFVVLGLVLCEHALKTRLDGWKLVTTEYLRRHREMLQSRRFSNHWDLYDRDLIDLWKKVRKEPFSV